MSVFPGPANPVVYAQYILQGRWRRMLLVAGISAALIGGVIWLTTFVNGSATSQQMTAYVGILAGLQVANLLIFGSFRVESAVRTDVTSRMIESHRLMPAPALGSILGYLFGATLQANLLAIVNFILGAICCVIGGLPVAPWALANAVLFCFAVFVHAMIMQLAFIMRGGFLVLIIAGFILISLANTGGLQILPSLHVLLYPLLSRDSVFIQIFNIRSGSTPFATLFPYGCSFAGQAIIAAVAIRVSIRRYLSSTVVGISPPLGLILLATWVALALAGLGLSIDYGYHRGFEPDGEQFAAQAVATFATAMLLAMWPIASAARTARQWHRTGDLSGPRPIVRFSELWTLLAAAAILGALLLVMSRGYISEGVKPSWPTAVILLNFLISMACFFSQGYARRGRPWIIVVIWVPLTWVGPVVVDAIFMANSDIGNSVSGLTAFSAPGALALLWSGSHISVEWGIIGQSVLTLIPVGLLLLARRNVGGGGRLAAV